MADFKIDFIELMILAESCVPPNPIARMTFWYKLTDTYYDQMNEGQRKRAYNWISKRLDTLELWKKSDYDKEAVEVFLNRYNPENQWMISTIHEGEKKQYRAFLHNGKYHVNRTRFIADEYVECAVKIII